MLSRRQLVKTLGAAGAAWPRALAAAARQPPQGPPSTVTTPPRDFGPNAPPTTYFTDPDVLTVDPLFGGYVQRELARSRGCGPARCGARGRRGPARGGIWYGATSRTTGSCAGSKTTSA